MTFSEFHSKGISLVHQGLICEMYVLGLGLIVIDGLMIVHIS